MTQTGTRAGNRPEPIVLVAGLIARAGPGFAPAMKALEERFGEVESESPSFEFTHTRYYEREMGSELHRAYTVYLKKR